MPRRKTSGPKADRPHMPGYGISEGSEGLLPWSWARERLEKSRNYWISSVRPDGRPHVMPVWGVWMDDRLFLSTAITSRKARNLLANPDCVATTESATEAVIVEARAEVIGDHEALKPVWAAYKAKYDWPMDGENMFVLEPRIVFAFIETTAEFATTATRWRFD